MRSVLPWRPGVAPAAFLILLLLPVLGHPAGAADWYVDPSAGQGGAGTAEEPFRRIESATAAATAGDRILLGPGTYTQTRRLVVDGRARRALLVLVPGVEIVGAGRGLSILEGPDTAGDPLFGITAEGVDRDAVVRDLTVRGSCFQGINLRGASPTILRVDVLTDVVGGSSTAVDVRDGSDPLCRELRIDGGHSALFVEFGSAGRYEDCTIGRRMNEGLAISQADPVFVRCVFEGAGRDLLVLNQGSQPRFTDCVFARGDRWMVRVASNYPFNSEVDLGGNRWFTSDLAELEAATLDAEDDPNLGADVRFEPLLGPVGAQRLSVGRWKGLYFDRGP